MTVNFVEFQLFWFEMRILINFFLWIFCRENETEEDHEARKQSMRDYHAKLPDDQKQQRLDDMREYTQQDRAAESNLRRSERLRDDKTNHKIFRMLNPNKEKDA